MSDRVKLPAIGPLLWYRDPRAAIAWLEKAFGFETRLLVEDDRGGVVHSELGIGNGRVGVVGPGEAPAGSPATHGGRYTQAVHVQMNAGIDEHYARAQAAGARVTRALADQPYGDRVYVCADPEGHIWSFGQTIKPMTPREQARATGHSIRSSLNEDGHD